MWKCCFEKGLLATVEAFLDRLMIGSIIQLDVDWWKIAEALSPASGCHESACLRDEMRIVKMM